MRQSLEDITKTGLEEGGIPSEGTLGQRYLLKRPVGRGGSAAVYLAWDRACARHVALKLPVHPAGEEWRVLHLMREVAAAADLAHPSLARLLDWGVAGDQPFLAYEYLGGGSLAERLRGTSFYLGDLLRVLARVADGLAALHRRGWVHADVTPGNILFDRANRPKLGDFGLARPVGEAAREGGCVLASSHYAPLQQLAGSPLTPAVDTFALCAVLYRSLTGSLIPREREASSQWETCLVGALEEAAPEVGEWVGPALLRGLAPIPDQRYPDGAALCEAFNALLARPLPRVPVGVRWRAAWMDAPTAPQPSR